MTEKCQARWEATEEQIETIIIPAMKNKILVDELEAITEKFGDERRSRLVADVGFYENISWDIYDVGTWFVA